MQYLCVSEDEIQVQTLPQSVTLHPYTDSLQSISAAAAAWISPPSVVWDADAAAEEVVG